MARGISIWRRQFFWAIVGVAAVVIVIRATLVASHTPGGWEILRDRLVAGLPPVLADKESAESRVWYQAKQRLLDEADRVEKNSSSTADECMGIAWALAGAMGARSSPNPAIVGRLIWGCPPKHPLVDDWHEIDRTLQTRAQQLAAKATSLQPEQVDWWRLRTLLMVWVSGYAQLDTQGLLDGLKHDPENALYEYLLAIDTMKQAVFEKKTDQGPVHIIADDELFESGQKLYLRAASKKTLLCGEGGWHTLADFISNADAPLAVKLTCINPAGFELATEELAERIDAPFDESPLNDLPQVEVEKLTNWRSKHSTWLKQIAIAPETLWLKDTRKASSFYGAQGRWGYIQRMESLLKDDNRREYLTNLLSIAGIAADAMTVMLLILSLAGVIGITVLRKKSTTRMATALLFPPIVFVALLLLTFGFLGMVGAYQPQLHDFPWPIGTFLGVVFVLACWLFWKLSRFTWRQSRLPAEERSRLFHVGRLALVIGASIPFIVVLFCLTDFKFREVARNTLLKFPTCIISQPKLDYAAAESQGANWHTVDFAALEWCVRGGAYWTVGLTVLCLLGIGWRRAKTETDPVRRLAAALRFTVRSTLWLAVWLLLASVTITTWWTYDLQTRYQRDFARLNDQSWLTKLQDDQLNTIGLNSQIP
jgi:hypothetical protein